MFIWDEDNIRWMKKAAEATGYYEEVARLMEPYLKKTDRVLEIGCGLGNLACALAERVAHITAIDIDEKALNCLNELVKMNKLTNVTSLLGDWERHGALLDEKFEIVTLSYVNGIRKNWEALRKLSKGQIIAVLANGESGTGLRSSLYNPIYEDLQGRDTIVNIVPFLERMGVEYTLIECELEYGQPLESIEDAYHFISKYYKGEEKDIRQYLYERLIPECGRYYLPKIKKSGILIIAGGK